MSLDGRRVLVTGADGFIGSHLVERLVELGATVRAFTFYNSWESIGWLSDLKPSIRQALEIFPGDIRDTERVRCAVDQAEIVFHLASLVGIPYSYVAVRSYFDTNVEGALNLFEACRSSATIARVIHTSTSEVYGSAQTVPISEAHPLVGQSPYAASKIAADKIAESYHLSYGVPVVVARPFNTFGPRQTPRAVIPATAIQLIDKCEFVSLGAMTPTRDFNYVTDTVEALVLLATCAGAEGETVNIGTGEERSIGDMVRALMDIVDHSVPIVCEADRLRPKDSEVERLLADASKLQRLTSWKRHVSFEEGLRLTCDWLSKNIAQFGGTGRFAI